MSEKKNPKRYYYAIRNRYMRELKQVGHKLSLAITEEEDALLWERYEKILSNWRSLEKPESIKTGSESILQRQSFWKPEFSEAYVELTQQLRMLYAELSGMKDEGEREAKAAEIRQLKKQRSEITVRLDRETGDRKE